MVRRRAGMCVSSAGRIGTAWVGWFEPDTLWRGGAVGGMARWLSLELGLAVWSEVLVKIVIMRHSTTRGSGHPKKIYFASN